MSISLRCRCILNCFIWSVSDLHAYHIAYSVLEKPAGVSDEEITWWTGLNGVWNTGNRNVASGTRGTIIANEPSGRVRETCPFTCLFLVKDSPIWSLPCSAHTSQDSSSGRLWHGAMCKTTNKKKYLPKSSSSLQGTIGHPTFPLQNAGHYVCFPIDKTLMESFKHRIRY